MVVNAHVLQSVLRLQGGGLLLNGTIETGSGSSLVVGSRAGESSSLYFFDLLSNLFCYGPVSFARAEVDMLGNFLAADGTIIQGGLLQFGDVLNPAEVFTDLRKFVRINEVCPSLSLFPSLCCHHALLFFIFCCTRVLVEETDCDAILLSPGDPSGDDVVEYIWGSHCGILHRTSGNV